jgi:hypothetical protein
MMSSSAVVAFSPVLKSYNVAEGIQAQCYKAMDRLLLSRSRIADGILALGQETFDLTWGLVSFSRRLVYASNGPRCEDKNIS